MLQKGGRVEASTLARGAIDALLDTLADDLQFQPDTVRQRRWALRELLTYAAGRLERTVEQVTVGDLLDHEVVAGWLELAEHPGAGSTLRVLNPVDRVASPASQRVRLASMRALASFAGLPAPRLTMPRPQPAREPTPQEMAALFARLAGRTPEGLMTATWVRTVAIARLIRDTGAGEAVLAKMKVDQVHVRGTQPAVDLPERAGTRRVPVGQATRNALGAWLTCRADIVRGLSGGEVTALWVRIRPAARGQVLAPAGLPISARGLRMGWSAVMAVLAEQEGVPEMTMRALRLAADAR